MHMYILFCSFYRSLLTEVNAKEFVLPECNTIPFKQKYPFIGSEKGSDAFLEQSGQGTWLVDVDVNLM